MIRTIATTVAVTAILTTAAVATHYRGKIAVIKADHDKILAKADAKASQAEADLADIAKKHSATLATHQLEIENERFTATENLHSVSSKLDAAVQRMRDAERRAQSAGTAKSGRSANPECPKGAGRGPELSAKLAESLAADARRADKYAVDFNSAKHYGLALHQACAGYARAVSEYRNKLLEAE